MIEYDYDCEKKTNTAFEQRTQKVTWSLVEMLLPELHFHFTEQNYIHHETNHYRSCAKTLSSFFFPPLDVLFYRRAIGEILFERAVSRRITSMPSALPKAVVL